MARLLFVCVENACRSQMAEAFARRLTGPGVEVFSAGSDPAELSDDGFREVRDEIESRVGDLVRSLRR